VVQHFAHGGNGAPTVKGGGEDRPHPHPPALGYYLHQRGDGRRG
jgi:hypothetical protein